MLSKVINQGRTITADSTQLTSAMVSMSNSMCLRAGVDELQSITPDLTSEYY